MLAILGLAAAAGARVDKAGAKGMEQDMTEADRARWDQRYTDRGSDLEVGPPSAFIEHADLFPSGGSALELACGDGRASVWLACRGMRVLACDVSVVAIECANELATRHGVADRCTFVVADLDDGLPAGGLVDLVLVHRFRDPALDVALIERLQPGGVLAYAALSEVGAASRRFRAEPGELLRVFGSLEVLRSTEADGLATLIARKPG